MFFGISIVSNVKEQVGTFKQEKALVGAFSMFVKPNVKPMDRFTALVCTCAGRGSLCMTERCRCGLSLVTASTARHQPAPAPASVLVQRPTYHRHHWCCRQPSSGHGVIIAHTTITITCPHFCSIFSWLVWIGLLEYDFL